MGLARIYEENNDYEKAVELLRRGIQAIPEHRELYANGFYVSARAGRLEAAKWFIQSWLERYPADEEFRRLLDDFDQVIYDEFGIGEPPDTSGPAEQK